MTKKIISLCLVAAMLFTMIPATVFAADAIDSYITFNGFPTTWVNAHTDFTVTAKDGVTAMSVNGNAVQMTEATAGGGVISAGGKPYVKYKALSYDGDTGVLNIGAFIGNIKSGKGHGASFFSFKYDTANWAPYDLSCETELTAIDEEHYIDGCFIMGYASTDKASYNMTSDQAAKAKKITLETSESGALINFATGVAGVTWYTNIAELDATEYEVPAFRFALIKKGESAVFNANTITQPTVSEIGSDISVFDRTVTSSTQMGDTATNTVYTTDKGNIEYAVEALDGTMYGVAPSTPASIVYEGNTASFADEDLTVSVTTSSGTYNKTYEVLVDTVNPTLTVVPEEINAPVQKVTFTITANDDKSGIKEVLVNGVAFDGTEYEVTEDGTYTFQAVDNAGNKSDIITRTVDIDNEGPALEVSGNPTEWTNQDVVITIEAEDGATVTVNGNGIFEAKYTVTENGTYTFVAQDAAGNKTTVPVEVVKIDKTAPVLEISKEPTAATKSHKFTVEKSTDADSDIKEVTVSFEGGEEIKVEDGEYIATESGTYLFTAYDNAGNKTEVERIIAEGLIDNTAPVVTVVGTPDGWATADVTLTVTTDETATVVVYKDGEEAETLSGTSYTVTESGTYKLVATDVAGNVGESSEYEIRIDKDNPTVELSEDFPTDWIAPGYEVSLIVGDGENGSGVASVTVNDEEITGNSFEVTENIPYVIVVTDNAGRTGTKTINVSKVDLIKPVISGVSALPTDWVKSFELTFAVADEQMGVASVEINGEYVENVNGAVTYTVTQNEDLEIVVTDRADNSETQTISVVDLIDEEAPVIETPEGPSEVCQHFTFRITATDSQSDVDRVTVNGNPADYNEEDGVWEYYIEANGTYIFKAYDKVGRESEVSVEVENIDNDKPVITLGGYEDVWTNEDVVITIGIDKEVESLTVTKDEVSAENITGQTSYTVTENGTYTFTATDVAGNVGTNKVVIAKIDKTNPEISVAGKPDGYVKNFWATVEADDAQSEVTVTVSDGENTFPVSNGAYYIVADGTYTFTATDEAGNAESAVLVVDNIDTEKPSIESENSNEFAKEVKVTLNISDNKSDASKLIITLDGEPFTGTEFTATENRDYVIVVTDEAGNVGDLTITIDSIDNTAPTVEFNDAPTEWTNSFILSINANDTQSGVEEIKVNNEVIEGTTYDVPGNGTYTVTVTDKLGNSKQETVVIDKLDKELPSLGEVSGVPTEWVTSANLTVVAEDALSGVKEVAVNGVKLEGETTYTYNVTARGEYKFVVTDNAGNVFELPAVNVDKIDETAPVFSGDIVATENGVDNIKVSLPKATDDSDVAVTYELFLNGEKVEAYAGEEVYSFTDLAEATVYTVKFAATDIVGRTTEITLETATAGLGSIEASFDLSGLGISAETLYMNVWIGDKAVAVGADGKVVFEHLAAGTYKVTFKAAGFFDVAKAEIVVENNKKTTVAFTKNDIVAGDAVGDGVIDIYDLNAVASAFADSYDGETGIMYDFNRDGKVNEKDIEILVANYNKAKAE